MKQLYAILLCCFIYPGINASAQLADGSTAPDFTFTDINGNTQNLYSYLNQGKYVAIDISATWCVPCWNYHNTYTIDSIYQLHDQPGLGDWKVMFIEADGGTNSADLNGTGTNTQGNWVQGASYTIIDPPAGTALTNFRNGYVLSVYPTFYMICPNKKVYQDTFYRILSPRVSTWEFAANSLCAASGIDDLRDTDPLSIYPNPASGKTTLYFATNSTTGVKLTVSNLLGQRVALKDFGRLSAGDQSLIYDTSGLQPGVYRFTLSITGGRSVTKKVVIQ